MSISRRFLNEDKNQAHEKVGNADRLVFAIIIIIIIIIATIFLHLFSDDFVWSLCDLVEFGSHKKRAIFELHNTVSDHSLTACYRQPQSR